ncbi:hypothetical protein [Rugamonas sp.]|uniref:hypothetical protein n=1 Tax=Rugamonas sp. TaxID=1926287 RepID=UPI0025D77B4C|nr:hypothetical protein [Rugamonas sp.]
MSTESERMAAANKERLIKEGQLYRLSLMHAKAMVGEALQPDALLHGAVDHAAALARARFGALMQPGGLSGINFKSLMPYLLTTGSFIWRKKLLKPVLGVAAVAALGGAWLLHRKRQEGRPH